MFGIPVRVPFLIVMLLATIWIFVLVWCKPELLRQKSANRWYVSLLESVLCSLLWGGLLAYFSTDPLESLILSAVITGCIWFGIVFYSRNRFAKVYEQPPPHLSQSSKRTYL
jgi:hypothetical protein